MTCPAEGKANPKKAGLTRRLTRTRDLHPTWTDRTVVGGPAGASRNVQGAAGSPGGSRSGHATSSADVQKDRCSTRRFHVRVHP